MSMYRNMFIILSKHGIFRIYPLLLVYNFLFKQKDGSPQPSFTLLTDTVCNYEP